MTDTIISFETAKLAKEKGFNCECRAYYNNKKNRIHDVVRKDYNGVILVEAQDFSKINYYSAPTQALIQKWLREEQGLYVEVNVSSEYSTNEIWEDSFYVDIKKEGFFSEEWELDSYENALEKGLIEALKLI